MLLGCNEADKDYYFDEEEQEFYEYKLLGERSNVFVNYRIVRDEDDMLKWGNSTKRWTKSMSSLIENRDYKVPPSVLWVGEDYICLGVNHSGPYSETLFLPLKEDLDVKFFKEDIEYMDSTNQFVLYIIPEPEIADHVKWEIQSLVIDDQKERFEIEIYENSCCYPWYQKISRDGDQIIIKPQGDKSKEVKKNIEKYCI